MKHTFDFFLAMFVVLGTVCACQEEDKTSGDQIKGHEYVDLGLSVRWATCNVGASSPEEYGDYFAWGEIETKDEYDYDDSVTYGKIMGDIAGDPQYDVARAKWGGSWRLPTASDFNELIDNCTWIWTTRGGHNGYEIFGPNGSSIFLPATGSWESKQIYGVGEYGYYWSSMPDDENHPTYAYALSLYSFKLFIRPREFGQSVRPVSE